MATAYNIMKNTARAGNAVLGIGCYSAVMEKRNNDSEVIKISNNAYDPWLHYYEKVIKPLTFEGNPCVPRVDSFYIDYQNDYYIATMERLESDNYNDYYEYVRDYIVDEHEMRFRVFMDEHPRVFPYPNAMIRLCDEIRKWTDAITEGDCDDISDNWEFDEIHEAVKLDLHSANFMFRGEQLVITDPYSNVDMDDVCSVEDWADNYGRLEVT
jgi:hypothetical protein